MLVHDVLFDVGGVVEINPNTGWLDRWLAQLQLEARELERCLDAVWAPGSIGALTLEEIERQTADALRLDHVALAALMNDMWAEYFGTLNQALADYFGRLRPRYKTGILSNSFVGAREHEQAAYDFESLCDVIVYSHEVGCLKPDPRIYRVACERLGVAPEATVSLDDVQANVDGARAVGMRAITFASNWQAIADLQAQMTAGNSAYRRCPSRSGISSRPIRVSGSRSLLRGPQPPSAPPLVDLVCDESSRALACVRATRSRLGEQHGGPSIAAPGSGS